MLFISIPKNHKKSMEKLKFLSKFPKVVLFAPAVLTLLVKLQKRKKYAILFAEISQRKIAL